MLNKSFGVIYFHFNIFSEKTANKWVLKFAFFEMVEFVPDLSISHYYRTKLRFSFKKNLLDRNNEHLKTSCKYHKQKTTVKLLQGVSQPRSSKQFMKAP